MSSNEFLHGNHNPPHHPRPLYWYVVCHPWEVIESGVEDDMLSISLGLTGRIPVKLADDAQLDISIAV